jgi:xanthine dehydrogenase large subunit
MSANPVRLSEQALIEQFTRKLTGGAGSSRRHESADKQVSGKAEYLDDRPALPGLLHLCPVLSEHAHARIVNIDVSACLAAPGVVRVFGWQNVPGELDIGPLEPGDPLFAREIVEYHGQVVLTVAAETPEAARAAAQLAKIEYEILEPVLDVEAALARKSYVQEPHIHKRGDAKSALAATLTGRPAKMRVSRRDDMRITGKRHPFFVRYDVGFTDEGMLNGVVIDLAANCGYSLDLSGSICDRAMFHADNAYYLGDALITGYRCRTNLASNTAFRGFGGPQGMVAIEQIMDHIARELELDPLEVRKRNYYGEHERNVTHYHQTVEHNSLPEITRQLEESAGYAARRAEIEIFNRQSPVLKRGLALTPVKFGISFTSSFLNQAGALIVIYTDGTVQLNHGGTEMGQGLNTKVTQIVASVLQIPLEQIQVCATNTGKVPNTSPTAASSGTDLNGKAAESAAQTIKDRLVEMLCGLHRCSAEQVEFRNGVVKVPGHHFTFAEVANMAWLNQVPLSASGFYKVPGIHYDRAAGRGQPFYYFSYGAACSEVIVDTLTGEYRLLRTDILHDVGTSLNPALDIGQIEGGFIQGAGWLTCEELVWSDKGQLMTDSPMSYKIPAIGDAPADFRVSLLAGHANPQQTVYHSKAVGEPPFMLGISVWCAMQDAVASVSGYRKHPLLDAPATPERVFWGCQEAR